MSNPMAQRHITARMYIAAPLGRLGLRGAAARRCATWPLALVGLGATSHTCDSLWAITLNFLTPIIQEIFVPTVERHTMRGPKRLL
jgi:hypothetical protein